MFCEQGFSDLLAYHDDCVNNPTHYMHGQVCWGAAGTSRPVMQADTWHQGKTVHMLLLQFLAPMPCARRIAGKNATHHTPPTSGRWRSGGWCSLTERSWNDNRPGESCCQISAACPGGVGRRMRLQRRLRLGLAAERPKQRAKQAGWTGGQRAARPGSGVARAFWAQGLLGRRACRAQPCGKQLQVACGAARERSEGGQALRVLMPAADISSNNHFSLHATHKMPAIIWGQVQ